MYLNFLLVLLRFVEVHCCSIPVEWVNGVWVCQQLWQERLENVGQICKRKETLLICAT